MMEVLVLMVIVLLGLMAMLWLGKKGTYRSRAWEQWERRYPGVPPSGWFILWYGPPPE